MVAVSIGFSNSPESSSTARSRSLLERVTRRMRMTELDQRRNTRGVKAFFVKIELVSARRAQTYL